MKICSKCCKSKALFEFNKHRAHKDGLRSDCKPCSKIKNKSWYEANADKKKAANKRWRDANTNKKKEINKRWQQANPDKINASTAKRRAAKLQSTPPWLTQEDLVNIQQFYTAANQLTSLNGCPYHVDHIVPLQGKTVCGLHVPWNLQVLQAHENMSKSNKLALI